MTAIEIRPIAGALGAEVHGVDLSETLSNSEFDAVHQAFLDHQVIFFRDQGITPEQHIAFGRRFGEVLGHQGTREARRTIEDQIVFVRWHVAPSADHNSRLDVQGDKASASERAVYLELLRPVRALGRGQRAE